MRLWNTRWRPLRRASLLVAPLALVGCVTQGSHDEVVRDLEVARVEAARLQKRNAELSNRQERLEAGNESLAAERVVLREEVEDLRQAQAALAVRARTLDRARGELESDLRAREGEIRRLRETYDGLLADLESELESGRIQVEQLRSGLRLNLPSDVLFASGSAQLNAGGRDVLKNVASRLKNVPHQIHVEGHTDDRPIRDPKTSRFPSNWELAGARAARVARWLVDAGVDPRRISAVSYGDYRPIASNDTQEGRTQNRRIDILLVPSEGAGGEGAPPVASGRRTSPQ